MKTSALVLGLCLCLTAAARAADSVKPVEVTLLLVTGAPEQPLAQVKVQLYSDNGRRCIKAPCPTNGRSWSGTTDSKGQLTIPAAMQDASMSLTPEGFEPLALQSGASGVVKLSCTPRR